eukprot:Nk52_evm33s266 gene=Nk52_evmTU33s266
MSQHTLTKNNLNPIRNNNHNQLRVDHGVKEVDLYLPWEYSSSNFPCRSFISPALSSYVPLWLLNEANLNYNNYQRYYRLARRHIQGAMQRLVAPATKDRKEKEEGTARGETNKERGKERLTQSQRKGGEGGGATQNEHAEVNKGSYWTVVAPRLYLFCLGLLLEYAVFSACRSVGMKWIYERLVVLASSHAVLVFSTRTFSNTIEYFLVGVLLIMSATCTTSVSSVSPSSDGTTTMSVSAPRYRLVALIRKRTLLLMGTVVAIGCFVRFTFVLYAFPVLALSVLFRAAQKGQSVYNRILLENEGEGEDEEDSHNLKHPTKATGLRIGPLVWASLTLSRDILSSSLLLVVGFVLVAAPLAVLDSLYFGSLQLMLNLNVFDTQYRFTSVYDFLSVLYNYFTVFSGEELLEGVSMRISKRGTLLMTPLNSLLYNLNANNLQDHGLHPQWTHFLVNFPILTGPLALLCMWFVVQILVAAALYIPCMFFRRSKMHEEGGKKSTQASMWPMSFSTVIDHLMENSGAKDDGKSVFYEIPKLHETSLPFLVDDSSDDIAEQNSFVRRVMCKRFYTMCFLTILCGIGFLSVAPHQEMRFLLPVILPSTILFADYIVGKKSVWFAFPLWILFNLILSIFFGFMHQGGLVPSLMKFQSILCDPSQFVSQQVSPFKDISYAKQARDGVVEDIHFVFYHTYMPPRHLLMCYNFNRNDEFPYSSASESTQYPKAAQGMMRVARKQVTVHDLGGASLDGLSAHISTKILNKGQSELDSDPYAQLDRKTPPVIFIIAPSTVEIFGNEEKTNIMAKIQQRLRSSQSPPSSLGVSMPFRFPFHFSGEDPPSVLIETFHHLKQEGEKFWRSSTLKSLPDSVKDLSLPLASSVYKLMKSRLETLHEQLHLNVYYLYEQP